MSVSTALAAAAIPCAILATLFAPNLRHLLTRARRALTPARARAAHWCQRHSSPAHNHAEHRPCDITCPAAPIPTTQPQRDRRPA